MANRFLGGFIILTVPVTDEGALVTKTRSDLATQFSRFFRGKLELKNATREFEELMQQGRFHIDIIKV